MVKHIKTLAEDCESKKEFILKKLKENGCRITKQRIELLDIILENECSSCKEIYYKALKKDPKIGTATVYRMVNILEDVGAIDRKNMYRVADSVQESEKKGWMIELDDHTVFYLSPKKWNRVLQEGLRVCGYLSDQSVSSIKMKEGGLRGEK